MKFIDSHSHLFLEEFSDDLDQVIQRARATGISHILMPNIDSSTIERMLKVTASYKNYCFPMLGLHPTSVDVHYEKELGTIMNTLETCNEFVAIGEIGIDLYWDKTYIEEQKYIFERQIQLALEHHLPIVIHCRDAFEYVYDILLKYRDTNLSGVFHSFMGTKEEAEKIIELKHFMLGINGVVTFKKSLLPEVLTHVSLDHIILETDSPYLTPVPHRGRRNESAFLKNTLIKIGDIYHLDIEDVAKQTYKNTLKVFGMLK